MECLIVRVDKTTKAEMGIYFEIVVDVDHESFASTTKYARTADVVSAEKIQANPCRYCDGIRRIAVPKLVVDSLMLPDVTYLPNTGRNWERLLANVVVEPLHKPEPTPRGSVVVATNVALLKAKRAGV